MAGIKRHYTSLNQVVADEAFSNELFRESDYEKAKETGTDIDYLMAMADTRDNLDKSFDKNVYDRLSDDDRFNYFLHKNYGEKGTKEYDNTEAYFNNQIEQMKRQEVYNSLSGFEKAVNSIGGFVGNAVLQLGSIAEGLVDASIFSLSFLAQSTGIPLIAGKADEVSDWTKKAISKDTLGYNAAQNAMNDYISTYTFIDKTFVTKALNDITTGIVKMAPMLIPGAGTAGAITYYGSMMGNTAEQTIKDNPDINYGALLAYTGASVGLEALTEWASGKLFGDDIISSLMKGEKYAPTGSIVKNVFKNFATEGLEEATTELFGSILYNTIVDPKADIASFGDIMYAALIGGLTGAIMSGGQVLTTKKMSVMDGKLVETSSLTKEQLKTAKNLTKAQSYGLNNLIYQAQQATQQTDEVTKLMSKYGLSLQDVQTEHAEEYQEALEKDTETKTQQAKGILELANLMNTIGVEQFQRSSKLLNEHIEEARTMVNNYLNHSAEYNKAASDAYSAAFDGQSMTPTAQLTNSEQTLVKTLREVYPNLKVAFGTFGSKEGLSVRSIAGTKGWLFIESGLVDKMGYQALLEHAIKNEMTNSMITELEKLPVELSNSLVRIVTEDKTSFNDLSEEQKQTIAQIVCFDPVNNRRIFRSNNKVHSEIFKYITDQANFIKNYARKNEANTLRYRELLKIRNTFFNSISQTINNAEDVEFVTNEYKLAQDEVKTKLIDKTSPSILNINRKLTAINLAKDAILREEAIGELLDARNKLDKTTEFDYSRLYDESYYADKDWVNSIKTQQQTNDFKTALKQHLVAIYKTSFDDRTNIVTILKNNLKEQDVRKAAKKLLTKEFNTNVTDYNVLQNEVVNTLYDMLTTEIDDNTDYIVVEDNTIKGGGKLKFFKGDVYERFNILGANQREVDSKDSRKKVQRELSDTRTYSTQSIEDFDVVIQDDTKTSLDKYQRDIIRATKKAYGMNVKFFKNAPFNRITLKSYDDVKGFISKSRNTIYIRDDGTVRDIDVVTVVRHEIVHHLLDKIKTNDKNEYNKLLSEVNQALGDDWKNIRRRLERVYKEESAGTIDEETLVAILNEEIDLSNIILPEVLSFFQNKVFDKSEYNDPLLIPTTLKTSTTDDLNRKLSNQQQKYFERSAVRDTLGRLLTMYHGTPYGGFTKYDMAFVKYGLFGKGFYHTDNPFTGERYSKKRTTDTQQIYEVYLNITNPIDMDAPANRSEWMKAFPDVEFPQTGVNEVFFRTLENYLSMEEMLDADAAELVLDGFIEMGYDGITHTGGTRLNSNDPKHRVYIAFYSEQIKSVYNTDPTTNEDIRFSRNLSDINKQTAKNIQNSVKAKTGKEIADAIIGIVKTMPMKMSEAQGFETPYMYRSIEDLAGTLDNNSLLFHKINDKNWTELYGALHNSVDPDSRQALILLEAYLRIADQTNTRSKGYKPLDDKTRFSEQSKNEIMALYQSSASLTGQQLSAISKMVRDKTSFSELKQRLEEDGFTMSMPDKVVQKYVPEVKDKKSFEKEINKQIDDITEQIENGDDLDKAALNQELSKLIDKKYVILNESNEAIIDWALSNEDVPTVAAKIQQDVFKQFVATAELAEKTEGKKALTILVDEKTGLPKPFPKTTQYVQKAVKGLKSFRMWAMLTSPVSWVRNWVGNAGMTALDKATNQFEKFLTNRQPKVDITSLEKQQKALQNKKDLTPTEKAKLAELNAQITRAYDFKFVETTASKDLKKQITEDYKTVFQQILNGEDVSKYEGSAEKAGAIARAERDITRKSENANFVQKVWAACQSMTDWGLNTGVFGDNAVVLNSLVRNFANMVESNKTYLIKSLTTEYGKDGSAMSDARRALVEKALKSKDSMDIINAMSKADVELFMDSCKQRTFEQYFKNSNWLSKWTSNLSQKHPIAASLTSLVLPFPKVAANVLTMAYKYSPFGFISALRQWSVVKQMDAEGYKGYRDAFARAKLNRTTSQATVGTMMCIAGLILASLGFIDIEEDDYMGPSLHIGDLRISLSDLAPSMTTLSVGAGMMWAWKNDKSAVLTALDVLYDNTLLGNIENVFRYGSPDKYIENLSINYVSQYVPAMLKLFTKITTNQEMIDKSGTYFNKLWKTFGSGIPGIAHVLPKRVNPYTGEFLTSTGSQNVFFNFIEALSPLDFETTVKSPTQKEAERLNTKTTGLSGTFKVNDTEYVVDKVTYSKYRADYIQTNFEQILSGKQKVTVEDDNGKRITTTYDKLTDKQKKNVIDRLYTDATTITKIKWWTDLGNKYVVTNEDQYKQYRKLFDTRNIVYKETWNKSKFMER